MNIYFVKMLPLAHKEKCSKNAWLEGKVRFSLTVDLGEVTVTCRPGASSEVQVDTSVRPRG